MAGYKGKQGRKKLPTQIKIVKGTFRKHRANKKEPKPETGIPEPQIRKLNREERRIYDRAAAILDRMGVLTKADVLTLEMYAQTQHLYNEALKKAKKEKLTCEYIDKDGVLHIKRNPIIGVVEAQRSAVNYYLSKFGLDPSSRASVQTATTPPDREADKWGVGS